MPIKIELFTQDSTVEDVKNKLSTLYHSNAPLELVIESTKKVWKGIGRVKTEEMLLPLGGGIFSGLAAVQCCKAACNRFENREIISGLFYTSLTCLAGFICVHNFNQFVNVTYAAGSNKMSFF